MTTLEFRHIIQALHQERCLPSWQRDFIRQAYATSLGGEKPFHLTAKQQENVIVIYKQHYQ